MFVRKSIAIPGNDTLMWQHTSILGAHHTTMYVDIDIYLVVNTKVILKVKLQFQTPLVKQAMTGCGVVAKLQNIETAPSSQICVLSIQSFITYPNLY